ncbi:MAG: GntR family transcriptional regulator [Pseudomonadota bacterium]
MTASISDKASQITTDCVYRIATGVWPVGSKLPSLRQGTAIWDVDPLTIKRAYEALEARGLVRIAPRSGVYVRENAPVFDLRKNLQSLETLYLSVQDQIARDTGLSVVGAFRYLAQLAEQRADVAPECAFVECTTFQSQQLAGEVQRALNVPCSAIALDDLRSGRRLLLPSEGAIFTTGFHYADVSERLADSDVAVVQVAVQFMASRAREVVEGSDRFAVFCLESEQGELIAKEVALIADKPDHPSRVASVSPSEALRAVNVAAQGEMVLVSPSLWQSLPEDIRQRDRVLPYAYDFDTDAIRIMASAVGLPLGGAGCTFI